MISGEADIGFMGGGKPSTRTEGTAGPGCELLRS